MPRAAYRELLGELQFSFVCFLIAHVYDGFEHWKQLVHVLCSCDEALHTHSQLYMDLIGPSAVFGRAGALTLAAATPSLAAAAPDTPSPALLSGVLHFQMMETPSDFFVDIVSADNFLVHSLDVCGKRKGGWFDALGTIGEARRLADARPHPCAV